MYNESLYLIFFPPATVTSKSTKLLHLFTGDRLDTIDINTINRLHFE